MQWLNASGRAYIKSGLAPAPLQAPGRGRTAIQKIIKTEPKKKTDNKEQQTDRKEARKKETRSEDRNTITDTVDTKKEQEKTKITPRRTQL